MDFQSKIAARRAEIAQQDEDGRKAAEAALEAQAAAEAARRRTALDNIAADMSLHGVPVHRQGDELELTPSNPEPLNLEGLRRNKLERLLRREARRMWTPTDNWVVISLIVSGLLIAIPTAGVGLLLTLGGLIRRALLNKRYAGVIAGRHPDLLGPIHEAMKI